MDGSWWMVIVALSATQDLLFQLIFLHQGQLKTERKMRVSMIVMKRKMMTDSGDSVRMLVRQNALILTNLVVLLLNLTFMPSQMVAILGFVVRTMS